MHRINSLLPILLLFLFSISSTTAQDKVSIAKRYIQNHLEGFELVTGDIEEIKLNDFYISDHNGVSHIYFKQRIDGIEVHNGILNINLDKENKVIHSGSRFVSNARSKLRTSTPTISPNVAIEYAAMHLDCIELLHDIREVQRISENKFKYSNSGVSLENIDVKLVFQAIDNEMILCWDLLIHMKSSLDVWSIRIDAITGAEVDRSNMALYCFGPEEHHIHSGKSPYKTGFAPAIPTVAPMDQLLIPASYRVFPIPAENPIDGQHGLVSDAPLADISTFGWHDINGVEGAEFTITRGNNVHAYLDEDANNAPDDLQVDGGPDLIFDYPFDIENEPFLMKEAGVVNMFYISNYMHDFAYNFGFDEEAGNYQANNYGNGGLDGDYVRAEGNDGSDVDNAVFNISQDGVRGRMTMFLWNSPGRGKLRVEAPAEYQGHIFATGDAEGNMGFGAPITSEPVTGQVAVVDSGGEDGDQGCTTIVNSSEVNGKIAIARRGECDFSLKAYHAQVAGAIGIIVCNNEEDLVSMGAGDMAAEVTIPAVFIRSSSCDTLLSIVENGVVSIVENPIDPPLQKSAMFSNGVIAHEYGHGISSRLTGGPSESGCLSNDEQMGEGWSDFFLLTTTSKASDTGEKLRGVGSYLVDDARGIRRFPYTTDMNKNPQTMRHIHNTSTPHPLGEVWTDAIWDLYWALVEELGFNPDLSDKKSGNATAIQLVMDGMKMQVCNPGFIDARDAILAADVANNNGENECLIWNVFARRGIGLDADQGSRNNRDDNIEAFNVPGHCESSNLVDLVNETSGMQLFPNPTNGNINVSLNSKFAEDAKVSIITLDGKSVLSKQVSLNEGSNQFNLELQQIPAGIYVVSIKTERSLMADKLIIY